MRDSTTTRCVRFPGLSDRPRTATVDVPNAGSDGGAALLKAADRRLGLIERGRVIALRSGATPG